MTTIDRLESLCNSLAVGEPDDRLSVRSAERPYRYEVYASGYPLNMYCATAREAEMSIRAHYSRLRQQLRDGTATPISRM
jgi:hypothetical protein